MKRKRSSLSPEINEERESAEIKMRLESSMEEDELKWVLSNKRGRRFIYRLLDRAGVWRLSFDPDLAIMSFREGQKNEGLRLLSMVTTHCPDRYTEMLKECSK